MGQAAPQPPRSREYQARRFLEGAEARRREGDRDVGGSARAHARLLGVDITELRTYDEQRGLWNPFHPADRDTIYMLARSQLAHAARDLAVLDHAETSARQLLTALLAQDGYAVEVEFQPFLAPTPAE